MGIGGLFLLWVRGRDKSFFPFLGVLGISGGLALSGCTSIIFYICFFDRDEC